MKKVVTQVVVEVVVDNYIVIPIVLIDPTTVITFVPCQVWRNPNLVDVENPSMIMFKLENDDVVFVRAVAVVVPLF